MFRGTALWQKVNNKHMLAQNGNFSETAKYQESTPASQFTPKFVMRLATGTDKKGDAPTQIQPPQY